MTNESWFSIVLKLMAAIIFFGFIGWYTHYTWSDCLEENSFITCFRMLY